MPVVVEQMPRQLLDVPAVHACSSRPGTDSARQNCSPLCAPSPASLDAAGPMARGDVLEVVLRHVQPRCEGVRELCPGVQRGATDARQIRRRQIHVVLHLGNPLLQRGLHRGHPHLHRRIRLFLARRTKHAFGHRHETLAHVVETLRDAPMSPWACGFIDDHHWSTIPVNGLAAPTGSRPSGSGRTDSA